MTRTLTWNGRDLPEELQALPPGRYKIECMEEPAALTREEEAGLEEGLAQIERNEVVFAHKLFPLTL